MTLINGQSAGCGIMMIIMIEFTIVNVRLFESYFSAGNVEKERKKASRSRKFLFFCRLFVNFKQTDR